MFKNKIFFEILQVAIGVRTELSYVPVVSEWYVIFRQANKQAFFEILEGGNLGKFDSRVNHSPKGILTSGAASLKRNFKFLSNYLPEILLMQYWKLWHWGWRKIKGYLLLEIKEICIDIF